MGSSYRYHLSTLIAVFLALGVGMLIGSSTLQGAIVQRLNSNLSNLRTTFQNEVEPLRVAKQQYGDWVAAVRPLLLKGRLAGKSVAVIQTGDYPNLTSDVQSAIEDAGATASSTTVVSKVFVARADRQLAAVLTQLRETHPTLDPTREAIIHVLARSIAKGGSDTDLNVLANAKLIERDGDYTQSVHLAVIVGGGKDDSAPDRVAAIDRPLVEQLKSMGVRVVFVEPSDATVSYIPYLQDQDVATVDNADTDIGQISTILAFASPVSDYGIKSTARGGILPRSAAQ